MKQAAKYGLLGFGKRVLALLRPYWGCAALIFLTCLLQLAFALLFPLGMQVVFDKAMGNKNLELLAKVMAALAAGFLVTSLAGVGTGLPGRPHQRERSARPPAGNVRAPAEAVHRLLPPH